MAGPSADPKSFDEAVASWRRRVPMKRGEWDELQDAERDFAFTVSNVASISVIADVWRQLDTAIENDEDFDAFKGRVGESLADQWGAERPGVVETIFRTNVLGSYAAGRHAIYSSPAVKEARPYLRFDAVHDAATDDECSACDDTILPQDDPWWASHTPPLHFNCRCQPTPLSREEVEEREGPDENGPDVEIDEGFGRPPAEAADEWDPGSDLPGALKEILDAKLRD